MKHLFAFPVPHKPDLALTWCDLTVPRLETVSEDEPDTAYDCPDCRAEHSQADNDLRRSFVEDHKRCLRGDYGPETQARAREIAEKAKDYC